MKGTHELTPDEIALLESQVAVVRKANQLEDGQLKARNHLANLRALVS
jgi:hypothetical protein